MQGYPSWIEKKMLKADRKMHLVLFCNFQAHSTPIPKVSFPLNVFPQTQQAYGSSAETNLSKMKI